MKNIALQIAPSFHVAPAPTQNSFPPAPLTPPALHTVSLSVQFDDEEEALSFAYMMFMNISEFKKSK